MFKLTPERAMVFLLWLGLYYYSYRYPFQMGSPDYSPAYSDTPALIQVSKYILYLAILGLAFISQALRNKNDNVRIKLDRETAILFVVFAYLCLGPLVVCLLSSGINAVFLFKGGIFLSLPAVVILFRWRGPQVVKGIAKSLDVFIFLAIAVELLQFALFWFYGRFPNMAAEDNMLTVRFGSIWDAPNPFAFFLSFLIPFAFYRYGGIKRVAAIFFLLITLLATGSLTGSACFIGAAVLLSSLTLARALYKKVPRRDWNFVLLSGFILIALVVFVYGLSDFIPEFLDIKSSSVSGHAASIENFVKLDNLDLLIGTGSMKLRELSEINESNWLDILGNLGVFYFLAYASVMVLFIFKACRLWKRNCSEDKDYKPVAAGLFSYVIASAAGMVNLPEASEFPSSLLLPLFYSLIIIMEAPAL